jgi:hypothetical protein
MAVLLRTINKARWFTEWLPRGEVPADALVDLRSTDNELSFWLVDESRVNLDAVIVALAANRNYLSKLDFAVIDEADVAALGIRSKQTEGDTPDDAVNKTWHRDLVELTGTKVIRLAERLEAQPRVSEKKVKEMLLKALRDGSLDRTKMSASLVREVEGHRIEDLPLGHA